MIRVLVVDDSAFMRNAISSYLTQDAGIEVVGTARDGVDCLEKVKQLQPDVITLDLDNIPAGKTDEYCLFFHQFPRWLKLYFRLKAKRTLYYSISFCMDATWGMRLNKNRPCASGRWRLIFFRRGLFCRGVLWLVNGQVGI